MSTVKLSSATQADAALCNQLDPPTKGVNVGGGIHVEIPDDWQARCLAGEVVPGCTANYVQFDGSLYVSDVVQTELKDPSITKNLDQAELTSFNTKLSTAIPVPNVVVDEEVIPP